MSELKPSADVTPSLLLQAVSGRCNTLLRSVARPKTFFSSSFAPCWCLALPKAIVVQCRVSAKILQTHDVGPPQPLTAAVQHQLVNTRAMLGCIWLYHPSAGLWAP